MSEYPESYVPAVIENDVPAIADDTLVAIADQAVKRANALKKIKAAALSVTNPKDWIDENGKPYLQVSGCEKIAGLTGISWRIDEPVFEEREDGHFAFTYKGYFSLGGREIEVIGTRSSSDPFFSRAYKKDIAPENIDRQNVKKAALTNLIGNGVTRLLGLRNLTWEEVRGGGIDTDKSSKVEYQKPEQGADTKEQREKIQAWLLEMSGGNEDEALDRLEAITAFTAKDGKEVPGRRDLSSMSEKHIAVTYGKVKDAHEKFKEAVEKATGGDKDA